MSHTLTTRLRDRSGAALPVALFGLVAVTLLVTTALLTSNTEFAISSAHRGAAASLYSSDAALEQYVADRSASAVPTIPAWMVPTNVPGAVTTVTGPDNRVYGVQVTRMLQTVRPAATRTDPTAIADEVFSLVVSPQNGRGRAVGAFLRVMRNGPRLNTNINAGATSGGNLKVSGNATISDGRSGVNYCNTPDNQSDFAVQVTQGSRIDLGNNAGGNLEGATNVTDYGKNQLEERLLGPGLTLEKLAQSARLKFGPRFGTESFNSTRMNATQSDTMYDWGCPQVLLPGFTCPAGSATRDVVVAIDAGGGEVRINGDYGQGMIIILNGSLSIQGNFVYKGIILVEKDMNIRGGNGGNEAKIEGAVVAFGESSTVEDNVTGTATIKYNFCAIQDAENALNNTAARNGNQLRNGGTYGWYELIR